MSSFKFEWKANRNFCLTTKHCLDFECQECDDAVENGTFFEYALKLEHRFCGDALQPSSFRLIGYYKTEKAADKAIDTVDGQEYSFVWNRKGECINGAY